MGSNYKKWKCGIELALGLMSLRMFLLKEKSIGPTNENNQVVKLNRKSGKDQLV